MNKKLIRQLALPCEVADAGIAFAKSRQQAGHPAYNNDGKPIRHAAQAFIAIFDELKSSPTMNVAREQYLDTVSEGLKALKSADGGPLDGDAGLDCATLAESQFGRLEESMGYQVLARDPQGRATLEAWLLGTELRVRCAEPDGVLALARLNARGAQLTVRTNSTQTVSVHRRLCASVAEARDCFINMPHLLAPKASAANVAA